MTSNRLRIRLNPKEFFDERGVVLPGSLWKESPFPFQPEDFVPNNNNLVDFRTITAEVQQSGLERFIENPDYPAVYGVGSAPADNRAKYFAAYLVQQYLSKFSGIGIVWENLNVLMTRHSMTRSLDPAFLVITNVFNGTSMQRMERLRDALEAYENIPRIVVVGGMDPFGYVTGRLGYRLDNVFFHAAPTFKPASAVV